MSAQTPLYQRDEAYPEDATDLVLLLAAEDGATYETIREQLEEIVLDAMVIEIENIDEPVEPHLGPDAQPESREPFDSLRLLDNVDYIEEFSVPHYGDEDIALTERGERAVEALRRGMLPNQREALSDINVESAPRVADGGTPATATRRDDLLREVRTRRDKALRFSGETDEGEVTWFVAYRGKFGWAACRENGRWMDEPSDDDVEAAVQKYDEVELVDQSNTPEQVTL